MSSLSSSLYAKLSGFVERQAWPVILASLLLTGGAMFYTASNLGINTSTTDMISPEVPFRVNNIAFNEAFPETKNVIAVVINARSSEQADDAAERLAEKLSQSGAQVRDVYIPAAEPYLQQNAFLLLPEDELTDLADRLASAAPILGLIAEQPNLQGLADMLDAASENEDLSGADELALLLDDVDAVANAQIGAQPGDLSWQDLLSGDLDSGSALGPQRIVLVQPVFDYSKLKPAQQAIGEIRSSAAALGLTADNGVSVRLTGPPAIDQDELDRVESAGIRSGVLSFMLIFVLLSLGLRSVSMVIATAAALLMGLAWTAGFATLAIGHLNLISVAFAVLFIGLGVDFGIHLCLRFREEATKKDYINGALGRTFVGVGGALVLTTVSAAAGFFSFLPTDYLGLAELGLISGAGMFISLIASLITLPALLKVLPAARSAKPLGAAAGAGIDFQRHGRTILTVAGIAAIVSLFSLPFVSFDSNPINLRNKTDESVATFLDLAKDPNTTPYTINVLATTDEQERDLKQQLKGLSTVDRVISLDSFVPKDQEDKFFVIDEMAFFLSPVFNQDLSDAKSLSDSERTAAFADFRQAVNQLVTLGGDIGASAKQLSDSLVRLPAGAGDLAAFENRLLVHFPRAIGRLETALSAQEVTIDDIPQRLTERWVSGDGKRRLEIFAAGGITENADLQKFADEVLGLVPTATGAPVNISESGKAVTGAFQEASTIAFVLIVFTLLVVLRRLIDMALVLVPIVFAGLFTILTAVLLGLPFNLANIIVLPLLLGLGVSSGVHFVMRRRQVAAEGELLGSSTPRAVMFSALTTIASFGSLALSGHQGMTSMGQLLTIAIGYTLLSTIVILPALMAMVWPSSAENAPQSA